MAIITVSNNRDSGSGSLREAIASAQSGDIIQFSSDLSEQTIILTSGDIDISESITIDASTAENISISGNELNRIFHVDKFKLVKVKGLNFIKGREVNTDETSGEGGAIKVRQYGHLVIENSNFIGNVAERGGAIHIGYGASATITDSLFDGNDGSIANDGLSGGAIATAGGGKGSKIIHNRAESEVPGTGFLDIRKTTFTNNKGTNGAVYTLLSGLRVEDSIFRNNEGTKGSGAIFTDGANGNQQADNLGGTTVIRNVIAEDNTGSNYGGAFYFYGYSGDKYVIENTQITGNTAFRGGGLGVQSGLDRDNGAELIIRDSGIANNTALSQGGGAWTDVKGGVTLEGSIFSGNRVATPDGKGDIGGAIVLNTPEQASSTITDTTFVNNYADRQSGNIWIGGRTKAQNLTITDSQFAGNRAGNRDTENTVNFEVIDGGGNTVQNATGVDGGLPKANMVNNLQLDTVSTPIEPQIEVFSPPLSISPEVIPPDSTTTPSESSEPQASETPPLTETASSIAPTSPSATTFSAETASPTETQSSNALDTDMQNTQNTATKTAMHNHNDTMSMDFSPQQGSTHSHMEQHLHGGQASPDAVTNQAKVNEHAALFSDSGLMATLYGLTGSALESVAGPGAMIATAVQSGSWSDPATWGGVLPGENALVHIPNNVAVDYDVVSDSPLFSIFVEGELHFAPNQDTKLVVDTLITAGESILSIGTETNPVATGVSTDIIIRADGQPVDQRNWDTGQFTKGIVTHGKVDIFGAKKISKLVLAQDVQAGDTALVLQGSADGWAEGDTLILAGTYTDLAGSNTDNTRFHDEELIINGIIDNGDGTTTITFINLDTGANALRFAHTRPEGNGIDRSQLNIYVANLSRNITIAGEAGETSLPENGGNVHTRGHVMLMHNPDVQIHNAAFMDLGRSDKNQLADSVDNAKGRYSLHFHRTGAEDITQQPAEAEGVVVKGSPGWGLVHHQSHLNVIDSVVYETVGSGIVAEAGDEIGIWRDNFVAKVTGSHNPVPDSNSSLDFWNPGSPNREDGVRDSSTSTHDFGRAQAYWLQGAGQIQLVDNSAASAPTAISFFADSWELANKDAKTVAVGNLRIRTEQGEIIETDAYRALINAGYSNVDRVAIGALPPKGVEGFEAGNVDTGMVFWLVGRNPDGDEDFNPIYVTGDRQITSHDGRGLVSDVTLWGVNENGILLQDSSAIDFQDISVHAASPVMREQNTQSLGDVQGVAFGKAGSTKLTVVGLNATGFEDVEAHISLGPDATDKVVGSDGQDIIVVDRDSTTNDYFVGGAGDDELKSAGGNDILIGGDGNDLLMGSVARTRDKFDIQHEQGVDRDLLIGGKGDDVFTVAGEDAWVDQIYGGEGWDEIQIKGGGIYGAVFNRFNAYKQSIEVIGQQNGDPFFKFSGTETADHLDFRGAVFRVVDNFDGFGGDDLYWGVEQDEGVFGGEGHDFISGEGGHDHLEGDVGNDVLRGGDGRNWLEGGEGYDTFQAGDKGIQIVDDLIIGEDQIVIAASGVQNIDDLKAVQVEWNPENRKKDFASNRNNERALFISWGNNPSPVNGEFLNVIELENADYIGVLVRGHTNISSLTNSIKIVDQFIDPVGDFTHPVTGPDIPADIDPADLAPGLDQKRLANTGDGPTTANDLGLDTSGLARLDASDRVKAANVGSQHTSLDSLSGSERGGRGIYAVGDDENNQLQGSTQDDVLEGGDGDDYLVMLTGRDVALGGAGDDMIKFGHRNNDRDETFADIDNPDVIHGGTGYDIVRGAFGNVGFSEFSRSANSIEEVQSDNIYGANDRGNDDNRLDFRGVALRVENLAVTGLDDGVKIDGRTGDDVIYGNRNNNTILGGDGNDILSGEAGHDTIEGGSGNDVIRGGTGKNTLTGGAGADIFEVGIGEQTLIQDFTPGTDTLRLTSPVATVNQITEAGKRKKDPDVISTELILENGSTIRLDRINPSQFNIVDVEIVAAFDEIIDAPDWASIDDPSLRGDRLVNGPNNHNDHDDAPDPGNGNTDTDDTPPTPPNETPTNTAPIIVNILDDITIGEGETSTLSLNNVFTDPDGDALTYTVIEGPSFAEVDLQSTNSDAVLINPKDGDDGTYTISVQASDGTDVSETVSFQVLVEDTIIPPTDDPNANNDDVPDNGDSNPGTDDSNDVPDNGDSNPETDDSGVGDNEGGNDDPTGPSTTNEIVLLDNDGSAFNGNKDAIIIEHQDMFQAASGSLTFRFKPTDTKGKQALFSKDSSGYDDGGHLTLQMNKNRLELRAQTADQSFEIKGGTINSGNWHEIELRWSSEGLQLSLDGNEVGRTEEFTDHLTNNLEPIVFGANQWASDDQVANKLRDFFSGEISSATFINDSATAIPSAMAEVQAASDITQLEDNSLKSTSTEMPALKTLSLNVETIESYGDVQDSDLDVTTSEQGNSVKLSGNGWKKLGINHTITPETVMRFEFRSEAEGDIHSIGFDNDNTISESDRRTSFQLFGVEEWGINDFETYMANSGWQSFEIPVGEYFTGKMTYLTFGNNHDVISPSAMSEFRNIMLHENNTGINSKQAFQTDPLTTKVVDDMATQSPESLLSVTNEPVNMM